MSSVSSSSKHVYPHRKIFSPEDQPNLYTSKWFHSTIGFILHVNMILRGKHKGDVKEISKPCLLILDYFNSVSSDIENFPPINQPQRFGNIAYRHWCDGIRSKTLELCRELLQTCQHYPEGYEDEGYNDEINISITKHRKEATELPELTFPTPLPASLTRPTRPGSAGRSSAMPTNSPSFAAKTPSFGTPPMGAMAPSFATKAPSFATKAPSFGEPTPMPSTPPMEPALPGGGSSLSRHHAQGMRAMQLQQATTTAPIPGSSSPTTAVRHAPQSPTAFSTFQQRHQIQTDPHITLPCSLAQELCGLLLDSYGNYVRIDYGTGHELSFMTFLAALYEAKVVTTDDYLALGIVAFGAYLKLVRKLQVVYWLEPAGSKGAWGLDDYQFLPFLFGTSQLVPYVLSPGESEVNSKTTPSISDTLVSSSPTSSSLDDGESPSTTTAAAKTSTADGSENENNITNSSTTETGGGTSLPLQLKPSKFTLEHLFTSTDLQDQLSSHGNLMADALIYLRETKTGLLQIHSPILYSLASLSSCDTANAGLLRMYGGEVLSKFPVMQHVKFGSLLYYDPVTSPEEVQECEQLQATIRISPSALRVQHPNASLDAAFVIRQK